MNNIIDPANGDTYSIFSVEGKNVLKSYIQHYQLNDINIQSGGSKSTKHVSGSRSIKARKMPFGKSFSEYHAMAAEPLGYSRSANIPQNESFSSADSSGASTGLNVEGDAKLYNKMVEKYGTDPRLIKKERKKLEKEQEKERKKLKKSRPKYDISKPYGKGAEKAKQRYGHLGKKVGKSSPVISKPRNVSRARRRIVDRKNALSFDPEQHPDFVNLDTIPDVSKSPVLSKVSEETKKKMQSRQFYPKSKPKSKSKPKPIPRPPSVWLG